MGKLSKLHTSKYGSFFVHYSVNAVIQQQLLPPVFSNLNKFSWAGRKGLKYQGIQSHIFF